MGRNYWTIVVTQDKIIVSGHQRVRAFKELGIPAIESEIRIYNSDDEVLLDLLESNIRRRGEVGGSAKKVGKRIKELERLYGIKQGGSGFYGNQYTEILESSNNFKTPRTQEQLAKDMGMTVQNLQNYKMLADMIPELDELVQTGIVMPTTALVFIKKWQMKKQVFEADIRPYFRFIFQMDTSCVSGLSGLFGRIRVMWLKVKLYIEFVFANWKLMENMINLYSKGATYVWLQVIRRFCKGQWCTRRFSDG